jgi:hypothetical protein
MHSPFDVFRLDPSGAPVWIGIATDGESACELIRKHACEERTRFMLWSQDSQKKTFYEATKTEVARIGDEMTLS